jgi:hypothetical protein
MITISKLKVFARYGGDCDMWSRSNEYSNLTDTEWYLIDSLLQDITIIKNGQASVSYINAFNEKLSENTDGKETIDFLISLIK